MPTGLVAKSSVTIKALKGKVWEALVNPGMIKQYMFGTDTTSEWTKGSRITWQGIWEGKPYKDEGVILDIQRDHLLQYSHFSPMTGKPNVPENYHTVTIVLSDKGDQTLVALSQDNNATKQELEHSKKNWDMMLGGMKKFLEK